MNNLANRLLDLKESISSKKEQKIKLEGKLSLLKDQLCQLGCDSVEDAEKKCLELINERSQLQSRIEKELLKIEKIVL